MQCSLLQEYIQITNPKIQYKRTVGNILVTNRKSAVQMRGKIAGIWYKIFTVNEGRK